MLAILNVIGPVFLLVGAGYLSVRWRWFPAAGIDGVVSFVNNFATPCLLFQAMLNIEFTKVFDPGLLGAFYLGAFVTFAAVLSTARWGLKLRPGDAVVVGFGAFFTNTVLLGLPIIHRAFGDEALPSIYAIIGVHSPLLMTTGMVTMELARRDGAPLGRALGQAARRIARNPLLMGIGLGMAVNLSGLTVPAVVDDATRMMAQAVLPAALFGLGGALNQYQLRDSWGGAVAAATGKLLVLPVIVLGAALALRVPWELARVAVLMAAMPSGLNVYVFATYFKRSTDVAANTILLSTVAGVGTISAWLWILDRLGPAWGPF
ncbi:MAG: AEC family transporter [Rhodobacterales bacterium]|nr:AEC family transporter [Rhodobacterales bacterium]